MRFPAGFIAVVLLAPAAATAQPKHEQNNERIGYSEGGTMPVRERVELGSPTPSSHGQEFFVVDAALGPFGRIELEATTGRVDVRRVLVAYTDGTSKRFTLDRSLGKDRLAVIDLGEPREIAQIVVTTDREPRGKYMVYGVHGSSSGVASR
jgi:hypothetical protein